MPVSPRTRPPVPAFALYGEPVAGERGMLLHAERIAVRSAVRAWEIRAHHHRDLHQILVVAGGSVTASVDGEELKLAAPCALFMPSGVAHGFRFQPGTEGVVVSFSQELAENELRLPLALSALLDVPAPLAGAVAPDLHSLALLLLAEFEGVEEGREETLRNLLGALLARVLRLGGSRAGSEAARDNDQKLLRRFRVLIERHYAQHHSIGRHARTLGVSEPRLRRCCLALTGHSPGELVHRRQVREAQRQLHYTARPIARIALDLGFADPAYFSRFFSQRVGVSPRQYRQRAEGRVTGTPR